MIGLHSRMISSYGGLVKPSSKILFFIFIIRSSCSGFARYIRIFRRIFVLTGTFQKSYLAAMLATFGVVLGAALYALVNEKSYIWGYK